ncbi:MAG TPA: copper-binding protein [Bryobacteraceae bacterium]|nr:copper-binding protein [Bryobacteraceae bacterium]
MQIFLKRVLFAVSLFGIALIPACSRSNQSAETEKLYPMTGEVLSLDAKDQTANIKAGPVPGWMDAMTMDFPIKSKSDFDSLRVGEKIKATVDVKGGTDYSLSNVQAQSSAK